MNKCFEIEEIEKKNRLNLKETTVGHNGVKLDGL